MMRERSATRAPGGNLGVSMAGTPESPDGVSRVTDCACQQRPLHDQRSLHVGADARRVQRVLLDESQNVAVSADLEPRQLNEQLQSLGPRPKMAERELTDDEWMRIDSPVVQLTDQFGPAPHIMMCG